MNVYLAKLMMYHEVHRMTREGHSISKISDYLGLNRRTVSKYLSMTEQGFEAYLIEQSDRKKLLLPYENFIKDRLERFQETSAAQMHDWLKEHYPDFPKVSPKTVFNIVHWVRDKHNLPRIKPVRQYQTVEEAPYGKQAQVDFGEYNMRSSTGKRVKVFFFTFILSRSRFKFIWFLDKHFTADLAIKAHELAFQYINGIPDEIVFDQDKVFVVSENAGDIILTDAFKAYTRHQAFTLHFCRKSDPESKGKIENVVKYVKQNFLYNRTFHNLDTLNEEAMGWLGRTANLLPHAFTQKPPFSELIIEKDFLRPYNPYLMESITSSLIYTVRKDNTISFKGNFYSLPLGTYKGRGSTVVVRIDKEKLVIIDGSNQHEICRHAITTGKGNKVLNTDHKRDKSAAINEMIEELVIKLSDPETGRTWLNLIKKDKPRYIRDQLLIIREAIEETEPDIIKTVVKYCCENNIASASDFKAVVKHYLRLGGQVQSETKIVPLNPLNGQLNQDAYVKPETSSIEEYQSIIKNKLS